MKTQNETEAGDENRTRVICLEGRSFTIKLLPQTSLIYHAQCPAVKFLRKLFHRRERFADFQPPQA